MIPPMDEHGEGGGGGSKYVAIMISVLACLLALIETRASKANNTYISSNIEAANLWAFYQAKSIRMTTLETAADMMEAMIPAEQPDNPVWQKRVADWRAKAKRYNSEPEKGEGRKELAARADAAEKQRVRSLAALHTFGYASAVVQIAIVLASASVVTNMIALGYGAAGLGLVGVVFALLGRFAPFMVHF